MPLERRWGLCMRPSGLRSMKTRIRRREDKTQAHPKRDIEAEAIAGNLNGANSYVCATT